MGLERLLEILDLDLDSDIAAFTASTWHCYELPTPPPLERPSVSDRPRRMDARSLLDSWVAWEAVLSAVLDWEVDVEMALVVICAFFAHCDCTVHGINVFMKFLQLLHCITGEEGGRTESKPVLAPLCV